MLRMLVYVEYALKAAGSGGNSAVAVRGEKTVAFITQKKVQVHCIASLTVDR